MGGDRELEIRLAWLSAEAVEHEDHRESESASKREVKSSREAALESDSPARVSGVISFEVEGLSYALFQLLSH